MVVVDILILFLTLGEKDFNITPLNMVIFEDTLGFVGILRKFLSIPSSLKLFLKSRTGFEFYQMIFWHLLKRTCGFSHSVKLINDIDGFSNIKQFSHF